MKERPIIMTAESVRAILAGRKTMTRWPLKPQPPGDTLGVCESMAFEGFRVEVPDDMPGMGGWKLHSRIKCPYGEPPDRLWCKEAWRTEELAPDMYDGIRFAADDAFIPIEDTREAADRWVETHRETGEWRSPLFMPRWASRLTLELTGVRVERLQAIFWPDALAEGMHDPRRAKMRIDNEDPRSPVGQYRALWDKLNGHRFPWDTNPWVWALSFRRLEP
jgi:hypothetical protein